MDELAELTLRPAKVTLPNVRVGYVMAPAMKYRTHSGRWA